MYGSDSWTLLYRQERRLNSFHMSCLRRIIDISWRDEVTNNTVLKRAGIQTMFTLLKQRRVRWLGTSAAWKTDASPRTFCPVSW